MGDNILPKGHRWEGLTKRIVGAIYANSHLRETVELDKVTRKQILAVSRSWSHAEHMRLPNFGHKSLQILLRARGDVSGLRNEFFFNGRYYCLTLQQIGQIEQFMRDLEKESIE